MDINYSTAPAAEIAPLDSADPYEFQSNLVANANEESDLGMIVNVTREYPFDYATVMFGYIMPFVLVLTLITNTLVVMVLAQKHMRTPTNIVLFTMAIVDLMTLLSPSPWYIYIYTLGYHDKFLYPPVACYAHHFMTDVIPVFFHTSSIWLALLLASQRYIYVCHPLLATTWCTISRVRKAIIIIMLIAFLHQITRFFDNKFEGVSIRYNQAQHNACKNEVSEWVQSLDIGAYYITYYTFRIVFVFIIPCFALITLNCLLFRALRRAENKRSELLKSKFKLLNRPSVAGMEGRPSSLLGNSVIKNESSYANDTTTTIRPSNNQHWPNRRKISSPLLRSDRFHTDAPDIVAARMAQRDPLQHCAAAATVATNHRSPTRNATWRSQADDEPTTRAATPVCRNSDKTTSDGRQSEARSSSEQSVNLLVEPGTRHGGSFAKPQSAIRGQIKQESKESNESYSVLSNQSNNRDENQSKSNQSNGRDDDLTCPNCALCEQQQLEYRKCRRSHTNGSNIAADRLHQPVSQCSSLIGNITNTTTNDEVSSCGNTHNIYSSPCVARDGTLDGIESASIREDEESAMNNERESASLHHGSQHERRARKNRKSISADGGTRRDVDLSKSSSIDNRLICGCPSTASPERSTVQPPCTRSNSSRRHGACRECCLASRCRRQFKSRPNNNNIDDDRAAESKDSARKCAPSCSSSDPCIKCNHQTQDTSGCKMARVRARGHEQQCVSQSEPNNYGEAGCNGQSNRLQSNADIYLDGNAAATATTTTTLYSTQANSVASLLQAQSHQQVARQRRSTGTPYMLAGRDTQVKSPSFVSTIGQGGRATVLGNGGSANPPALVVSSNPPVASLRTMDSNRTTLMLIVVVTVFLMVEVPVAIVTILHVILNTFDAFKDVEFSSYLNYIKLFTNFFIMISYSVNFTIYCSMSKKFRETFRDLFLCGKEARRKRAAGLLYQQTQHSQFVTTNNNNNNNNNNFNLSGASPTQFQSHEIGHCLGLSDNLGARAASLAAPGSQNNQDEPACDQSAAARYSPFGKRPHGRQLECEL